VTKKNVPQGQEFGYIAIFVGTFCPHIVGFIRPHTHKPKREDEKLTLVWTREDNIIYILVPWEKVPREYHGLSKMTECFVPAFHMYFFFVLFSPLYTKVRVQG